MATITGLTAARMQEIEDAAIVDAEIVDGNLILTKHDGTTIDAGPVSGPVGPPGPAGSSAIPGEVKIWPGTALPDSATYGHWAWANGDPFDISVYPIAAANIDAAWNVANGLPAPGAGKFRVPDLRGTVPGCLDALPVGSPRRTASLSGGMTRPEAIVIAKLTGEEKHRLVKTELAKHSHGGSVSVGGSISGSVPLSGDHYHESDVNNGPYAFNKGGATFSHSTGGNTKLNITSVDTLVYPSHPPQFDTRHTHPVSGSFSGSGGIAEDGSDNPHETVQPTVMVPYIVFLGV